MAAVEEAIRGMRVLLVEDDPDTRKLVSYQLERRGFTAVETAATGWEGVTLLEAKGADLVLLDLALPDIDGFDLLERIAGGMGLSVVVVTCMGDRETQMKALEAGASDFVAKPFDADILVLKVEKILTTIHLQERLERSRRRNQRLLLNILQVMAKTLEAKDPYTRYHSENVALYARMTGRRMGLDDDEVGLLQVAGILHDFGKIGVKESILNKPGKLTPEEYEIVKRHPMVASAIFEPLEELESVIDYIRHHHEFFNGAGYPDGLAGEDIPLGARILMAADAFDAMLSERPYRNAMTWEDAVEELKRCSGAQFDPDVVEAFLAALAEADRREPGRLRRAPANRALGDGNGTRE